MKFARRPNAFSLIEIMIAVLILGVSLVGLVHGVNTSLTSSKEAEVQSIAAMLAAGQIEILRASLSISEEIDNTTGEFGGDHANYSFRQIVTESEVEGLFEVTVIIERTGTSEEIYELKTMLFDPPVVSEEKAEDEKTKRRRQS